MLSTDIGIDLGASNTLIFEKKKGIVLNEPSIIIIDNKTKKVVEIGNLAYKVIGKEPNNLQIIRPFENGTIKDIEALELMLNEFLKKIKKTFIINKVLISVPNQTTQFEKNIIKEILLKAGVRKVYIENNMKTAALGIGLKIAEPTANMIIDIGGTTTDIAVLSLNEIVINKTLPIGGKALNEEIIKCIREKYKVLIGENVAEELKTKTIDLLKNNKFVEIKGKNVFSGIPTQITINTKELNIAVKEITDKIINEIIQVFEQLSPELSADIVEKGIVITGGSSKLKGLLETIRSRIKVPVFIAEFPMISVIEGTEIILNEKKYLNEDQ